MSHADDSWPGYHLEFKPSVTGSLFVASTEHLVGLHPSIPLMLMTRITIVPETSSLQIAICQFFCILRILQILLKGYNLVHDSTGVAVQQQLPRQICLFIHNKHTPILDFCWKCYYCDGIGCSLCILHTIVRSGRREGIFSHEQGKINEQT